MVGLDQRAAVTELAQRGLRTGRISEAFHPEAFGTVLRQTPGEGFVVPPGGRVDLLVSKGRETTTVPVDVVGLAREEAEVQLADRKLEVAEVVTRDGLHTPGTVLAVTPPPGSQVLAGASVALTVASGRVDVPDVQGQTQEDAVAALQRAGFSVRVAPRYADGPARRVLDQSPEGGRRQAGSVVDLVVSEPLPPPPAPSAPPPTAGPTPSASPAPVPGTG